MEMLNFDQFVEKKEYINKNPLVPQHPFRLLVIGPSGSGKSNLVTNLIVKDLHFDQLYIFARDLSEDKYEYLKAFFADLESKLKQKLNRKDITLAHFHSDLKNIPDIDKFDVNKQTLMVFDDLVLEKDQEKIKEIFLRGRKKNISTIYISQSFFKVPKMIRLNSNYVILFDVGSKREMQAIASTFAYRISFPLFQRLYKFIIQQPFGYMVIDCTNSKDLTKHIRNGFDGRFSPDVFIE